MTCKFLMTTLLTPFYKKTTWVFAFIIFILNLFSCLNPPERTKRNNKNKKVSFVQTLKGMENNYRNLTDFD